jgi:zinc protease
VSNFSLSLRACAAVIGLGALVAACGDSGSERPGADEAVWVHEASDVAVDPTVRYGVLENGMRYAIRTNETPAESVAVRMAFDMGSLGEADDQRGLAHFIEHMAFNGSTHVAEGEMVPLLERYGLAFGPDTNAFTSFETVAYQLDLPANNDEIVDTALFLMRETASELLLDADAIDAEREVIASEERFRNTPLLRWNNALTRFRLPETIIADRSPIGTIEVIQNAQRERFVDFYENYYVPERAMLVVVGDIDADRVEAKIQALFADWRGPEDARPDPVLGDVAADRPFSTGYFYDPEVFTILTIDAITPGASEPDSREARYRATLAAIGDAILARRLETIRASGVSPLLQTGVSRGDEFNIALRAGMVGVSAPERWEEALAIMEQELRRALEHGFTESELAEQMANLRSSLESAVDRAGTRENTALADGIWSAWRNDRVYTYPEGNLARFEGYADRITLDAVNAAFREIWDDADPAVFMASSIELDDAEGALRDVWKASAEVPVEPIIDQGVASFDYADFGPAGRVAERVEVADLEIVQAAFENGVRVTFKQTDYEEGRVRVRVGFGRGQQEPLNAATVAAAAESIFIDSGLQDLSRDELDRALAGRQVGLGFSVGGDEFAFGAATTPDDLELQLQLFAAYTTAPGWREQGMTQYQAVLPELRRNQASSPIGVLQSQVARMIRSGDTRFGFPSEAEAAEADLEAVRAFLTPALEQAPIEITIVGDIDEDAAMAALATTFGALPPRAESWSQYEENRSVVFPGPQPTPLVLRHNGPDYQAMVNTYWPTTDDSDTRRTRTFSLMQAVFGLKLTERLREAEGFTYSAFDNSVQSSVYPGYGYIWVGVDVRLENVDGAYAAVEELAADMAEGRITEDEMQRARTPLVEQIEEALQDNGAWMAWLSQSQAKPSRLDRIRSLQADYQDISIDEVRSLAQTYLQPDEVYRVTILPAE